jgi:RecA/RadA recombinase
MKRKAKMETKTKTKTETKTKTSSTFESSFLQSLIKESGNELASLMSEETLSNTTDWLDTGSMALNGLLSADIFKGVANNKIIGFAGPESTGKTFLVLSIARLAVQRGYVVAFFDSENSTEKEMLVKRDMDPSKFMYFPVDTVENFRNQTIKIINKYNEADKDKKPKLLLILDSLGNLSTRKEIGDSESDSEKKDMTRPGLIKSVFRVLSLKLAQAKVPMLVTNHVYDIIGAYVPTKEMAGGSGLKYAASNIILLTAKKAKDKDNNVTGKYLTAKSVKNRFCKEQSKITAYLDFKRGLHPFYGLQEFGEPMLKKEAKGWSINGKNIKEKDLWSTPWEEDLLKLCNENLNKQFAFGANESEVELTSDIGEDSGDE